MECHFVPYLHIVHNRRKGTRFQTLEEVDPPIRHPYNKLIYKL